MITNPKDFFQQTQNFVEEVALKIKAINGSLLSFLTKADAESTYLEKTEASNTYLGKTETASHALVADSATSADKATKDANGNNIANTYATIASLITTNTNVTNAQTTANQAKTSADASLKSKQDVVNALGYTPLESAPVTSVDGQTGAVDLSGAYQPKGNYLTSAPVTSVNGMTGAVTISAGGTSAYQIPYATCSTASNTAVKVATISNSTSFALKVGSIVAVKMTNAPAKMTHLNVNSTGQKPVKGFTVSLDVGYGGADECHFDIRPTGLVYVFVYDGTNWNAVSAYGGYEYVPDYDDGGGD